MSGTPLTIDGRLVLAASGATILEAARAAGIPIPCLCTHPDLPPPKFCLSSAAVYQGAKRTAGRRPGEPAASCGLCLVEVAGLPAPVPAGSTAAARDMVVTTGGGRIDARREEALVTILSTHPHACLTCPQRAGCDRSACTAGVPVKERCCPLLGRCELGSVARTLGIPADTPRYVPAGLPVLEEGGLLRDFNLCIACTRCVRACPGGSGGEVLGFVYDGQGRMRVGARAPTLEASGCLFCGACAQVCPTGALRGEPGSARERPAGPCPDTRSTGGGEALEPQAVARVPATEGVYRLWGADRRTLVIKGVPNLREALAGELARGSAERWFDCEEHRLYSQRESELLQEHLQVHGELPGGGASEVDDLY